MQSVRRRNGFVIAVLAAAGCAVVSTALYAHPGHEPRRNSEPSAKKKPVRRRLEKLNLSENPLQPQYGGQVTTANAYYFEVVYGPRETRIYPYSSSQRLLYTKRVTGTVTMHVRSSGQSGQFPVRYIPPPSLFDGSLGYLSVDVDLSRVRDGDMQATFELSGLSSEEPQVEFTQTFVLQQLVGVAVQTRTPTITPVNLRR